MQVVGSHRRLSSQNYFQTENLNYFATLEAFSVKKLNFNSPQNTFRPSFHNLSSPLGHYLRANPSSAYHNDASPVEFFNKLRVCELQILSRFHLMRFAGESKSFFFFFFSRVCAANFCILMCWRTNFINFHSSPFFCFFSHFSSGKPRKSSPRLSYFP